MAVTLSPQTSIITRLAHAAIESLAVPEWGSIYMRKPRRSSLRLIGFSLIAFASASHADNPPKAFGIAAGEVETASPLGHWQPVLSGRLKNGVRFAILPRRGDEPGLGLLMRNEGGFLEEQRPGERGLAHLIEHIAFLSPTTGAPDDLHHLVHIGSHVTFPAPSAGTTSWRETNYFFSTTTTSLADLDTMLGLLREVATDLTFRRDAVDEGRAQVVQEMAGRKLGNDIYADYIAAVAPGSPTDVIDAQNSDDVPSASIDTIRALYHRLYQPTNMMIVIVGNVDPAEAKGLIQKRFGDWKGARFVRTPVPTFQPDRITPISFSARPQTPRIAMVTVVMPTPRPKKSPRRQAAGMLMDMLAIQAADNRLSRAQPDAPPGKVGMFIEHGEQGHRLIMLWDNFDADQWRPAVAGLWRTVCDLRTTGFSDGEWEAARQGVLRDLEQRADTMGATANVELAKDLSHALAAHRTLIPPDQLLRYARSFLPTVSAAKGNRWFKLQWRAGVEHLRVEAPEMARVGEPVAAIRATADQTIEPPICKVRR
jgi:hypothetical protein